MSQLRQITQVEMYSVLQTVPRDRPLALDQLRLHTLSLTHLEIKQSAGLLSLLHQVGLQNICDAYSYRSQFIFNVIFGWDADALYFFVFHSRLCDNL